MYIKIFILFTVFILSILTYEQNKANMRQSEINIKKLIEFQVKQKE